MPNFKIPAKKHPITEQREKAIAKDKWNPYVGDKRYKTNMFLQFEDRFTKKVYEKSLLP